MSKSKVAVLVVLLASFVGLVAVGSSARSFAIEPQRLAQLFDPTPRYDACVSGVKEDCNRKSAACWEREKAKGTKSLLQLMRTCDSACFESGIEKCKVHLR